MASNSQFPMLPALGLYIKETLGDGNCLFRALADQLFGSPDFHDQIRATVVEHIRQNPTHYKQFIGVFAGGGTRRNPKRKNTRVNAPVAASSPSQADIDHAFNQHLENMACGGEWGDNMEIAAFCTAYEVDVRIYQQDHAYLNSPNEDLLHDGCSPARILLHIAYHGPSYEHYSSLRNIDGPHTGFPEINVPTMTAAEKQMRQANTSHTTNISPNMIKTVTDALAFPVDKKIVKQTLQQTNGNINAAMNILFASEDPLSCPSGHESSSIERDPDSDEDSLNGPNKRPDRRMSRASRAVNKTTSPRQRSRQIVRSSSRPASKPVSPIGTKKETSRERRSRMMKIATDWSGESDTVPDTDDEFWHPESSWKGNRSTSASPVRGPSPDQLSFTSQSSVEHKGPTRVKITWNNKSKVRQSGPERRIPARVEKDMKKQAQKAARRERFIAEAKEHAEAGPQRRLTKPKKASPGLDPSFQVLSI